MVTIYNSVNLQKGLEEESVNRDWGQTFLLFWAFFSHIFFSFKPYKTPLRWMLLSPFYNNKKLIHKLKTIQSKMWEILQEKMT